MEILAINHADPNAALLANLLHPINSPNQQSAPIPESEEGHHLIIDSNHPSPMGLYTQTVSKKGGHSINHPDKFQKFIHALIWNQISLSEKKLDIYGRVMQQHEKCHESLIEELHKLDITIANDTSVAFFGSLNSYMSYFSGLAGFISLIIFGGALSGLTAAALFVNAWTSAFNSFFQEKAETREKEKIPLEFAVDLSSDTIKRDTQIISKTIDEWTRLAAELFTVLEKHQRVMKLFMKKH